MQRIDFIGIDWQRDFVSPTGALSVPGANEDAKRVANLLRRGGKKFSNIYMSLDSHQVLQIFHPAWWLNQNNQHPNPFTPISAQEVRDGVWRAAKRSLQSWSLEYCETLEKQGRYGLFIWPYHCLLYTEGWLIEEEIANTLRDWEADNLRRVNFIVKGNNPMVEHYSVFQAEVQTGDHDTQLNSTIISSIEEADEIVLTGEALSHCLAWSGRDLIANFSDPSTINRMVLLTDASSSVTGFEAQGETFIEDMKKMGMRMSTTVDYLA